jgi:hypothetical protein
MPGALIDSLFRDGALPDKAGDKIFDCWDDLLPLIREH